VNKNTDMWILLATGIFVIAMMIYIKKNPKTLFDSGLEKLIPSISMGIRG
jgi:hypothetical protein